MRNRVARDVQARICGGLGWAEPFETVEHFRELCVGRTG